MEDFHAKTIEEVARHVDGDADAGVAQKTAAARLEKYGPNEISRKEGRSRLQMLLEQVRNPLVYILGAGAVLSGVLREWVDAAFIAAATIVSIVIGFWQEYKSANIFEQLQKAVEKKAVVVRGGAQHEIPAAEVVPGDIIVLSQGRSVPADARLTEARDLKVNEAPLTGESRPVEKDPELVPADTATADRTNMVYMGTTVEHGSGRGLVVATGDDTQLGDIAGMVQEEEREKTPLQQKMASLATWLSYVVVGIGALIFVLGLIQSRPVQELLVTAIAVAVAAVPEGLVPAISIILAIAAARILRKKGLVRRLVAAETLGSVSVVCTDKTGTLTEGRMSVTRLETPDGSAVINKEGLQEEASDISPEKARGLAVPLAMANQASAENPGAPVNELALIGDPTDTAVLRAGVTLGADLSRIAKDNPRVTQLPFSSERKFLASFHADTAYVAGAPEAILDMSNTDEETAERLASLRERYMEKGFRVVAIAERGLENGADFADKSDEKLADIVRQGVEFLALVVIRDPIRPEVRGALETARAAGARPVMATGDHKLTAVAVGGELGFATDDTAVRRGVPRACARCVHIRPCDAAPQNAHYRRLAGGRGADCHDGGRHQRRARPQKR